jgi:hypothetical protein
LTQLFGSAGAAATQLLGLPAQQQLQLIADKLDEIKNENEKVADVSALFGARGVTQILPLIENYGADTALASKEVAGAGGITSALTQLLSPGGKTSMASYQGELGLSEVGMEVGLAQLSPVLTKLAEVIVKLEAWLEKELDKGGTVHKATSNAISTVEHPLAAIQGDFSNDSNTAAKSLGIDSPAAFSKFETILKDASALGLDPAAVIATAGGEGLSGKPGDYGVIQNGKYVAEKPGTAGGYYTSFGPFQEHIEGALPKDLWPTAEKGGIGTAWVEQWANSPAGIMQALQTMAGDVPKGLKGDAAISAMVNDYEKPGAAYLPGEIKGDEARYQNIAPDIDKAVTAADSDTKTKAADMAKTMDAALLSWVQSALKHGKDFSSSIDAELLQIEKDLESSSPKMQAEGEQLILGIVKGMEAEMPSLTAEVNKAIQEVDKALQAEAEIKSPSELMARNGEELMRGLTLGIDRTAHEPALAAGRAAAGVISAAPAAAAAAPAGQTVHLEIPVQIDGNEVGRASCQYINGQLKLIGPIPARV